MRGNVLLLLTMHPSYSQYFVRKQLGYLQASYFFLLIFFPRISTPLFILPLPPNQVKTEILQIPLSSLLPSLVPYTHQEKSKDIKQ